MAPLGVFVGYCRILLGKTGCSGCKVLVHAAAILVQFCVLLLNPLSAVVVSPDGMGSCDMGELLMNRIGVRAWIFSFLSIFLPPCYS